jgi:hypothetical protein
MAFDDVTLCAMDASDSSFLFVIRLIDHADRVHSGQALSWIVAGAEVRCLPLFTGGVNIR